MPRIYEAIRDSLVKRGMDLSIAKTHAAKIYNVKHPKVPVGRTSDQKAQG